MSKFLQTTKLPIAFFGSVGCFPLFLASTGSAVEMEFHTLAFDFSPAGRSGRALIMVSESGYTSRSDWVSPAQVRFDARRADILPLLDRA